MDKNRFTEHPQLDSEGFVMADARCHGCAPSEMCPRSGYCERYASPLRFAAQYSSTYVDDAGHVRIRPHSEITLGSDHGIYHGLRRA